MKITELKVKVKKKTETETEDDETEKFITKLIKDGVTITIVSDEELDLRAGDSVDLELVSKQTTLENAVEEQSEEVVEVAQ